MAGRVRIARPEDSSALAAIYAPYVRDGVASFEIDPPDAAELAQRIAKILPRHPWLVLEQDEQVLGYAYASPHRERAAYRWSTDVTVYVAPQRHRQGIGRILYSVLLPILKLQGFHAAFAGITLPNAASVGLHEAFGFALIGVYPEVGFKAGAWRDVGWWGVPLARTGASPAEPRPFTPELLVQVL
ncbi:MAG: N-acetyltransferase [Alphaproteobacteria bacterium]|nr:N-acetyltransferase [Alphaproteobacteria bacterium]